MIEPTGEGKGERPPDESREHRFAFGRRWERRRRGHDLRRMWAVLGLDLILLLLVAAMAWWALRKAL